MNSKIAGQSTKTNYKNTGSSAEAVYYNEHDYRNFLNDALELGAHGKQMQFFDMDGHVVTAAEVMDKVDRHHSGLHKDDAKFYCIMLDPSDPEIASMGDSLAERLSNGQQYVFDVMDAYAKNFHREGISDRHDLTAYAVPHLYKGEDKKEQIHWHIIVARKDASDKYKLSPLTNHRGTTKGAVKGGFDRVAFDKECEQLFDRRFGYVRKVEESFDYCLAQKKGNPEQKAEQTQRLADQNRPDLEAAINAFLNQRVAQLAAEAAAREAAARKEAARVDRERRNEFWNDYHSKYRPEYIKLKEACDKSFAMYKTAKEKYGVCSEAITEKYNNLRNVYGQMNALQDDIQNATTAKGIVKAVSALVFFIDPVAGIVIRLVGSIIAEAERSAAIAARKDLRAQVSAIKDSIEELKTEQAALRQDKSDRLHIYVENREAKTELQTEISNLRNILQKPIEEEKPKITFDFVGALKQKENQPVVESANKPDNDLELDLFATMILATDRKSLDRELLQRGTVIEPILDSYNGVVDFNVILSQEGREVNASSLVSSNELRQILDRWEIMTKQAPAYKLEEERKDRKLLEHICRQIDQAYPKNAPRKPESISYRSDGSVQSVSFIDSRGIYKTCEIKYNNYTHLDEGSGVDLTNAPKQEQKESLHKTEQISTDTKFRR